jgi:hypothetical protein
MRQDGIMPIKNPKRLIPLLLPFILCAFLMPAMSLFGQEAPRYDFIEFDKRYASLLSQARREGYTVKEEEIRAVYGTHLVFLEKELQFYGENISLFFNQNRELIYFNVSYVLKENHSQTIINDLILSMGEKLAEKYGPNERETVPYYRTYENNYEIFLYPPGQPPEVATLSFKELDGFMEYRAYYDQEVKKLEEEEIADIVEKL